jgi:hypothetical protein
MGTENGLSGVELIGSTAGAAWHTLEKNGRMSLARLCKEIDEPRDVVMQAIGWLAREGKVDIEETGRGRFIDLR